MKKGIILAIAALTLVAGCDNKAGKTSAGPTIAKWKGQPYRIAFDTAATKSNPAGVTIPTIKFTANPEAIEKRVVLVVKFDASAAAKQQGPIANRMIMSPVEISGTDGALPADYMNSADKDLSTFLAAYCVKGKIGVSVALARSSLSRQADDNEIDSKRLSDWTPVDVTFKNPHPKC